jgi:hypothetical protein
MRRRTGQAGLLLLAIAVSLAGCQRSTTVSALNKCEEQIQVSASSVSVEEPEWITLTAGQRDEIAGVGERAQTLYVDVRTGDGGEIQHFEVPMDQLAEPPADTDYEAELVLAGDRCP